MIFSESENFLEFRLQKRENPVLWMEDYVNISYLSFPFHVNGGANRQYSPTFTSQRRAMAPVPPPPAAASAPKPILEKKWQKVALSHLLSF